MKDDEYTGILELREKISNEKINKLHTKYDKPFSDRRYQVYYQVCLSKAKLPFFSYNYFILKIKIAYRRNFAVLELYGIFGKKIKLQEILRKKNF